MNKQYQQLFLVVARNGALHSEQLTDTLKKEEGHEKEIETALFMRDKFNRLEDKILADEELSWEDYIQLYMGAVVCRNTLQGNINTWTAIVNEYDNNLIPKLEEISRETDATKRLTLIEDFFS